MTMLFPEFSMTETLFGGVLLASLLFFLVRKLGLSNFWAGIVSGALPFIGYMLYAKQHWPGGDVLAIHFAVYLANAGLLMVFGGMQQKQQKLHWGPRVIIGFFIGLVVLNAIFLSISSRGLPTSISGLFLPHSEERKVHTVFPGVVPHDRNISYEPHLARIEKQRALGWQVDIKGLDHIQEDKPTDLTIQLLDAQQHPIESAKIILGFWRMANSMDDLKLEFRQTGPGIYQATVVLRDEGRWLAELNIERGQDTYIKQESLFVKGD